MVVKKAFEIIEHTADVGIKAYGENLTEAFANAAIGMTSLIINPETIHEKLSRDITINSTDKETLLVEWLNEMIYYFDTENIVFKKFQISRLTNTEIKAVCFGEKVDRTIHEIERGIKSTTYYMIKVEHDKGYSVQVFFDI